MFSCRSAVGHNFCNRRYINYLLAYLLVYCTIDSLTETLEIPREQLLVENHARGTAKMSLDDNLVRFTGSRRQKVVYPRAF